uniref:Uncharacterized protein n=1 Tax=Rousettus aegyptiacus TaxID=9407 RepID=A0A7J8H1A5_ROUAE|nr:hypothetical protein HJG63_011373 [Rousettus aegyptiacus]
MAPSRGSGVRTHLGSGGLSPHDRSLHPPGATDLDRPSPRSHSGRATGGSGRILGRGRRSQNQGAGGTDISEEPGQHPAPTSPQRTDPRRVRVCNPILRHSSNGPPPSHCSGLKSHESSGAEPRARICP